MIKHSNELNTLVVAGLDMGTNKICAVITKFDKNGQPEILGSASVPSQGMRKGVVINIEQAALATIAALEKSELCAGLTVHSVILGVSGGHVESLQHKGQIALTDHKKISEEDIRRVINSATQVTTSPDREIIHVLPQSFSIDHMKDIKDPTGMTGSSLEVLVHIITVATSSVSNLIKSVYKAGFDTSEIVLKSLAVCKAVITEEEKKNGCVLIDMGASTTNYIIFMDGCIKHMGQLAIGGSHVTSDIAYGLKTTMQHAEQIKCDFGSAIASRVSPHEKIEINDTLGQIERWENRQMIAEIIQPRLEEILFLVNDEIDKIGIKHSPHCSIVLTGGVSYTENIISLGTEIFNLPVKIGISVGIKGPREDIINPTLSTAIGLSMYGLKTGTVANASEEKNVHKIVHKIQDWFNEFF